MGKNMAAVPFVVALAALVVGGKAASRVPRAGFELDMSMRDPAETPAATDMRRHLLACDDEDDCSSNEKKPYCVDNVCRACDQDKPCRHERKPFCVDNKCVACAGNDHCTDEAKPYCVNRWCRACKRDGHCMDPDQPFCSNNKCRAAPESDDDGNREDSWVPSQPERERERDDSGISKFEGRGFGGLGNQRGVWDDCRGFELLKRSTWHYTWGPMVSPAHQACLDRFDIEFVPMQWGGVQDISDLAGRIPAGAKHLLGFNEPNHHKQSNLKPEEAARLWPELVEIAREKGLRLGSPSAAGCGSGKHCHASDEFEWFEHWLEACEDLHGETCYYDFIAIHTYTCDPNSLRGYLDRWMRIPGRGNRPIWITEFACANHGGPMDRQLEYAREALQVLEERPEVERYAWFAAETSDEAKYVGATAALLIDGANQLQISPVGKIYMDYDDQ